MVRETFGPHPGPSSAPDIVTYLTRTLLLRISILLPVSGDALVFFFSNKYFLTQMETPLYNYLDDNTLLYMGTLARLPTYERYLGTQTITQSTPEIYWCSTFHPENLWQIKRKHTLTLLWPQWPFFVYQLSQHIPPGNISFKGNAAELVDDYAPEQLLLLQVPQDTHNQCSSHPSHTLAWNTSSVHSS